MDTKTLHINVPDCDISDDAHKITDFVTNISSLLGELAVYLNANAQLADLSCYLHTVAAQILMGPVAVHKGFAATFETIKDTLPEEALNYFSEVIRVSPFARYENDEEFTNTMKLVVENDCIIVPSRDRPSH